MRAHHAAATVHSNALSARVRVQTVLLTGIRLFRRMLVGLLVILATLLVASCDWINGNIQPTPVTSSPTVEATSSAGISIPVPTQATAQATASPLSTVPAVDVTAAPTCGPDWSIVASPNQDGNEQQLLGVAAVSASDVWAVGYYHKDDTYNTLVEHWNGIEWSIVPSPNPDSNSNVLFGVAAVSSNEVWAVGQYQKDDDYQTLVENWNGTEWSIVESPNHGSEENILTAVSVTSTNDVWAVGSYSTSKTDDQTLILHENGPDRSVVSSPNQGPVENSFSGIEAVSPNDVWAVGHYVPNNPNVLTLIEHWNGTEWSIVPNPNPAPSSANVFNAVAAASSSDVWAVGFYFDGTIDETLTEHWNGTEWSIVSSPSHKGGYNFLYGIDIASSNDVWAAGYNGTGTGNQTLIEHWNGTEWNIVPSPNSGSGGNQLRSIVVASPNDVWAVGYYSDGSVLKTLAERFKTCTGSPASTP